MSEDNRYCPDCGQDHGMLYVRPIRCDSCCAWEQAQEQCEERMRELAAAIAGPGAGKKMVECFSNPALVREYMAELEREHRAARREAERWKEVAQVIAVNSLTTRPLFAECVSARRQALSGTLDPET